MWETSYWFCLIFSLVKKNIGVLNYYYPYHSYYTEKFLDIKKSIVLAGQTTTEKAGPELLNQSQVEIYHRSRVREHEIRPSVGERCIRASSTYSLPCQSYKHKWPI